MGGDLGVRFSVALDVAALAARLGVAWRLVIEAEFSRVCVGRLSGVGCGGLRRIVRG